MLRIHDLEIPQDVVNLILENTTVQDQARAAQVCKDLNRIANRTHTSLFKYKTDTVAFRHGDTCLYIKKLFGGKGYDIYVKRNGKRESGMFANEATMKALVTAIVQGVTAVTKVLLAAGKKGEPVAREFSPSDYVAHASITAIMVT